MLRHLLEDLPLVEQRPHHPVEVVMLFVLGLVVRVLPETGHQGSVAEIRVNSLQGLVSLVVIVDPLLGHLNLLGRVDALEVEPSITLSREYVITY